MKRPTTDLIELVETRTLALSLRRIQNESKGYDSVRWRRALYHAIALSNVTGNDTLEKVRVALELP